MLIRSLRGFIAHYNTKTLKIVQCRIKNHSCMYLTVKQNFLFSVSSKFCCSSRDFSSSVLVFMDDV